MSGILEDELAAATAAAQIEALQRFIDADRSLRYSFKYFQAIVAPRLAAALQGRDDLPPELVGRALRLMGDRRAARAEFKRAKPSAKALAWSWEADIGAGTARPSLVRIERAVRLEPKNPIWRIWLGVGRLCRGSGWQAGLKEFTAAARLSGAPALAQLLRACCLRGLGKSQEAYKAVSVALKLDPHAAVAWRLRARLAVELGRQEAAHADCEAALRLDERLGSFALLVGYKDEAPPAHAVLPAAEQVLRSREEAWAYALRGDCKRMPAMNDFTGALADLRAATRLRPDAAWTWAYYGRAVIKESPEAGQAALVKAIGLDPKCGWLRIWFGEMLRRQGRLHDAEHELTRGLEINPAYEFGYAWRGGVRRQLGNFSAALGDLDCAIALLDGYPWARAERAQALLGLGRVDEALAEMDAAHRLDPKFLFSSPAKPALLRVVNNERQHVAARLALAQIALAENDALGAQQELSVLPLTAKDIPVTAWHLRGKTNALLNHLPAARKDFDRVLQMTPKWASAWAWRGEVRRRAGDAAGGRRDLSKAVALDGSLAWAWKWKAEAEWDLGRRAAALSDAASAMALNPTDEGVKSLLDRMERKGTMSGMKTRRNGHGKKKADPDQERLYLRSLIGTSPEMLERLQSELKRLGKSASARALPRQGRLLGALGREREALAVFDRAIKKDSGSAESWTLRGETLLLAGRLDEAFENLERAIALDPAWPWARLLRAVCLLAQGRLDQAKPELALAAKRPESRAAALAIEAIGEGQSGHPQRGIDLLTRALAGGERGWLFGMRGMLRRDLEDLPGSIEDFNRAEKLERSPWIYSHRADVLNRTGFYREALADLESLAKLLPSSAEPHAHAANIFFDQAFYKEALECMDRAIKRDPDSAALRARRARFYFVTTRLVDAQKELTEAVRLDPTYDQARFELLMVKIIRGQYAAAKKDLGTIEKPLADYLLGLMYCRKKQFNLSEKHFSAAAKAGGSVGQRAGYFGLVAKVLGEKSAKPKGALPDFYLCGIGIRHPFQTSVEALRALARCKVLYNNIGDPQIMEFLSLFPGEIRAVRRVWDGTALGRAERIVAALKKGETTGFVTRIHPFIYRKIAKKLVNLCHDKGATFTSFGAVSLTEVLWGLAVSEPGSAEARAAAKDFGLRVFDISYLNNNPDLLQERFGTVVYCIAGDDERKRLAELLVSRYPKGHTYYVLAGSGDKEDVVIPVPADRLGPELRGKDSGALLYVPGVVKK
jgi:tetratricopeptide (TPR) repeat protein